MVILSRYEEMLPCAVLVPWFMDADGFPTERDSAHRFLPGRV